MVNQMITWICSVSFLSRKWKQVKRKAGARWNVRFLVNYAKVNKYIFSILRFLHGVSRENFFPICLPCTLSARDARGVYVCLASVYPVIRVCCPCPLKNRQAHAEIWAPRARSCIPFPPSVSSHPSPSLPSPYFMRKRGSREENDEINS